MAAAEAAPQQQQQLKKASPQSVRPVEMRIPRLCRQRLLDQQQRHEFSRQSVETSKTTTTTTTTKVPYSSEVNCSNSKSQAQQPSPDLRPTGDVGGKLASAKATTTTATTEQRQPKDSDNPPQPESNSRRVPTFGSTPERIRRGQQEPKVPYFAYHGRARNVDLVRPADRQRHQRVANNPTHPDAQSVASSSSRSVSSLSQSNLYGYNSSRTSSCSAEQSEVLHQRPSSTAPAPATAKPTSRRSVAALFRRGYSNISNLFPDKPQQMLPTAAARHSSLADLSSTRRLEQHQQHQYSSARQAAANQAHSSTFLNNQQRRQPKATSGSTPDLTSAGTRQFASTESSMSRHNNKNTSATRQQQQQQRLQRPNKQPDIQRPSSARGLRRRSPSSSSMYHSQQQRRPQYVGAWSYELDPDCPVHGQVGGPCSPGGATVSRGNQHLAAAPAHTNHQQADLLYADAGPILDQSRHSRTQNRRGGSLYSPSSPPGWRDQTLTSRPNTTEAYYNGASRFSLYSNTTDSGRPRSSLAPAHEQVRRILGYQPRNMLATKPVYLHPQWAYNRPFIHLLGTRSPDNYLDDDEDFDNDDDASGSDDMGVAVQRSQRTVRPRFAAFNQLQDAQAIRAVDFHPSGQVYAVGSNSRALRICAYPAVRELKQFSGEQDDLLDPYGRQPPTTTTQLDRDDDDDETPRKQSASQPRVLFKFLQVHRGSIYCVAFNPGGQLLATGSNDQTVHLVRYNAQTHTPDGDEFRLSMHDGTVRELCFIDDNTSGGGGGSSLLLSAGGGDNKIYVTDCETVTPFQSMAGHTHMVMGLHHVGGAQFVSCSLDRTIRFWDLRTRGCTSIISGPAAPEQLPQSGGFLSHEPIVPAKPGPGAPVCAVRADPSGRLLVSGHSNATCMLYDIRASRIIQAFKAHRDEVRSVSFSPRAHYMLTGGYDGRLVLTDLQGDLSQALPSVCVAECGDKVVQAKWHPNDYTFVSTSADRTATLWALPAQV